MPPCEHWAAMPDDVVTMGFYNLETYDDYVYQTVNGITFGYLSYTEAYQRPADAQQCDLWRCVFGATWISLQQQIADMRPNCDVLVVSCHWGVEGSHDVDRLPAADGSMAG